MTMALPKGRSVVTAGLAALTGAGVALGSTVLDSTGEHLGAHPCHGNPARSVPRRCRLAIATAKAILVLSDRCAGKPVRRDGHLWATLFRLRAYRVRHRPHPDLWWSDIRGILRRLDSEAVPSPIARPQDAREPPVHSVSGGSLLLDSPHCALHRYAACFIDFNASPVLVCHPGADWIDRGRCGVRDHLERSQQGALGLRGAGTVLAVPGGIPCTAGIPDNCALVWACRAGPCRACGLEHSQMEARQRKSRLG